MIVAARPEPREICGRRSFLLCSVKQVTPALLDGLAILALSVGAEDTAPSDLNRCSNIDVATRKADEFPTLGLLKDSVVGSETRLRCEG